MFRVRKRTIKTSTNIFVSNDASKWLNCLKYEYPTQAEVHVNTNSWRCLRDFILKCPTEKFHYMLLMWLCVHCMTETTM